MDRSDSQATLSFLARAFLLALTSLLSFPFLNAQTITPAALNGARLIGGGIFSAFNPDYGPTELYGVGGFLDLNVRQHLGVEGEIRFLRFGQTYDVHEDSYAIGLRYRWQIHRYEPYGKFVVGTANLTSRSAMGTVATSC